MSPTKVVTSGGHLNFHVSEEPVGMRKSYRFGLDLLNREGWPDDDLVSYIEDDYLFRPDAFVALRQAAQGLRQVSYFAFNSVRPWMRTRTWRE